MTVNVIEAPVSDICVAKNRDGQQRRSAVRIVHKHTRALTHKHTGRSNHFLIDT